MTTQCRSYNGWSNVEETKLVEELVTMVTSGYLQHLEKHFKKALPDSDKSVKNIESKVKTMKKDWQTVYDMVYGSSTSGFGWDESNKLLTASNDVWNDYINVKANKDKEVKESDEELEPMMEGSHNVPRTTTAQVDENKNIEVDEVKQVRCKKRKRQMNPLLDGLHNVAMLLSDTLNKAATTMSQDIDFEEGLKKKRGMITNEIFKMTSLNQQEKYEVLEKIRSDVGYVEAYWDIDDTNRDGWVKYILLKK
ncbi:Myb/SANT-like domain, harbinger transposase-derived nuclease domain protein [Tanacetum coccineum]